MQPEKVIVSKESLNNYVDKFQRIHEIEVPELNELLDIKKGNAILKVCIASLDIHTKVRHLSSAPMLLLATVLDKIQKGEDVDVDLVKEQMYENKIHANTLLELEVFSQCVVEPKFTMKEVVSISEVFPFMINRVVAFTLGLNQQEEQK